MGCGFRRVLIANRGEIAVRIAHAVHAEGAEVAAVYSSADRSALHVRSADVAVAIGPPDAQHSYLNVARIIEAAKQVGADAIHPGYGFLSERPSLAEACAQAGIVLIGPSAHAMRVMGDKASARRAMQAAGVPIVPGNDQALDAEEASALAEQLGYPVLLKAAAGGGGKGMRLVAERAQLKDALAAAQSEAQKAFGDSAVYLEKALIRPRHIEVQVFADRHGQVVAIGERECSLQRRHQKVIEEAPSAAVSPALRQRMQEVACQAARAVNYVGAGTVEFLLSETQEFYFLEMNTRLQVEHAVTEAIYGVDLVRAQLAVAAGAPLPFAAATLQSRGHAIEARLYAEDPDRQFLPSPGKVGEVRWPSGPGIRVDAGIASHSVVSGHYDPMVAKIIAWDETRAGAIARLRGALEQTSTQGLTTNRRFLLRSLADVDFAAGHYHTGTLAKVLAEPPSPPTEDVTRAGLVALALARYRRDSLAATRKGSEAVIGPARAIASQRPWQLTQWQRRGL